MNLPRKNASPKNTKPWWAIFVGVLALASKFKSVFLLLKGASFLKLFASFGGIYLSALLYAFRGGWAFAIAFVANILAHEMGHGYAMRKYGMKVGLPVFVPFFGAFITGRGVVTPKQDCIIALAGPAAGGAVAILYLMASFAFGLTWLQYAAFLSFTINAFNLVPAFILDGNTIAKHVHGKRWLLMTGLSVGLMLLTPGMAWLMLAGFSLFHAFKGSEQPSGLHDQKAMMQLTLLLTACLGAGAFLASR